MCWDRVIESEQQKFRFAKFLKGEPRQGREDAGQGVTGMPVEARAEVVRAKPVSIKYPAHRRGILSRAVARPSSTPRSGLSEAAAETHQQDAVAVPA